MQIFYICLVTYLVLKVFRRLLNPAKRRRGRFVGRRKCGGDFAETELEYSVRSVVRRRIVIAIAEPTE